MNRNNTKQTISSEHRLGNILDQLSSTGFSSVSNLAIALDVSEMTIRRDLGKLESQGYIRRTHGGAITEARTQIELDYRARQKRQAQAKEKIGKLATGLVQNGQSIFVDAGTTTLSMAKHLKSLKYVRVVTNSLPVQTELLDNTNIEVILIGGRILTSTMSLVGTLAQENLSTMRFDWAFLGTGGIDLERGLTHSTMEEIPIKKNAAESATKVAVLADHTKFGYNALTLFMPIENVNLIITNKKMGDEVEKLKTDVIGTEILWP
jgi:DeoR family transcriptional regulator, fructose operon transcriptional repressor